MIFLTCCAAAGICLVIGLVSFIICQDKKIYDLDAELTTLRATITNHLQEAKGRKDVH